MKLDMGELRSLLLAAFDEGAEGGTDGRGRFYDTLFYAATIEPLPLNIADDDSLCDLVSRLRNIATRRE